MINGQEVNIQDMTGNRTLINFDRGDEIKIKTSSDGVVSFLLEVHLYKNQLLGTDQLL